MKIRKLFAFALALIMVLAFIPAAAFAEEFGGIIDEAKAMKLLDDAFVIVDQAEARAFEAGLSRSEVINAVHRAVLNAATVDKDSFTFGKDGFLFTVRGMYCAYDYRLRNEIDNSAAPVEATTIVIPGSGEATRGGADVDVFLVGPYYGHDSSFTDQYKREAQSIADATGGSVTMVQSTGATGPAIAQNAVDKRVVIYDSHGSQYGQSSYLCLTTDAGITSEDFQNGWAVHTGNEAWIDGRYIQNHISKPLSDTMFWMAICEGMKKGGRGTTGKALLEAGAGCVYGYSQSVTFIGDYLYEELFWNCMKEGATVADAFAEMVDTYGVYDPYGDAYPTVMGSVDPFPANPDSPQTVYCAWELFGAAEPVELTSFSLDQDSVELHLGASTEVNFVREPEDANNFKLVWTSSNESVAEVKGNNRRVTIKGVAFGSAEVTCTVLVGEEVFGTAKVSVKVTEDTGLTTALNVEGGRLRFGNAGDYPFFSASDDERDYAESGNAGVGSSESILTTVIEMKAGETLKFEYFVSTESGADYFYFRVNGDVKKSKAGPSNAWLSFSFKAPEDGVYNFEWVYSKNEMTDSYLDCVRIDNVEYSGTIAYADGDLNNDGDVTVLDAVTALRIAMAIIDCTDEQLTHGDVNGDGSITVLDAVIILRAAMGIVEL